MKRIILITVMLSVCTLALVFAQDRNSGMPRGPMGNRRQAAIGESGAPMTGQGRMMGRGGMMGGGPMMGRRPMMGGRGQGARKIEMYINRAEDLKLSDEQVKKLRDIRAAFQKDMINNRAKLATGHVDLGQLLQNDNPDMGAVEKRVRANHDIMAEIAIASLRVNRTAEAVLTADQRKAAEELVPRFPQIGPGRGMGGGRGRGMMGRPGMNQPEQQQ